MTLWGELDNKATHILESLEHIDLIVRLQSELVEVPLRYNEMVA